MQTKTLRAKSIAAYNSDDKRWQAVMRRDKNADGEFVFSVKTTSVYCRPSCGARRPRRENVRFHRTAADAERAGFRPCKRCRPADRAAGGEQAAAMARACQLIAEADQAPDLATLARQLGLSASHFHRVFKLHTGLTPKAYAIAHRSQRIRSELPNSNSVTAAVYRAGFNSNGRFYATSSKMLGMKPSAYRSGGAGAKIQFAVGQCSLGSILVAASERGICSISLGDNRQALVDDLHARFPNAEIVDADRDFQQLVKQVIAFVEQPAAGLDLPLDVRGTAFQHRVWRELCKIPCGSTRSYAELARRIGEPTAIRAVGQACAANQIAVAIPCHRAVRSDGSLSGYRWGVERKQLLLNSERRRRIDVVD